MPSGSIRDAVLPFQGTIVTATKSVSSTALKIPSGANAEERRGVFIYNNSSDIIYWGGSDVSTSNGIPIKQDIAYIVKAGQGADLYVISDGTNSDVRYFEVK